MPGLVANTSWMRSADMEARGIMMNIMDIIMKEKKICMEYCMKAIMSDLNPRLGYLLSPHPDDEDRDEVHDKPDEGHQDHHHLGNVEGRLGEIGVDLVEACLFPDSVAKARITIMPVRFFATPG